MTDRAAPDSADQPKPLDTAGSPGAAAQSVRARVARNADVRTEDLGVVSRWDVRRLCRASSALIRMRAEAKPVPRQLGNARVRTVVMPLMTLPVQTHQRRDRNPV